jgi:hypothetical protein
LVEPAEGEPHQALMWKPAEQPVWDNDLLPGVMAGKRPAPLSI